MDRPHLCVHSFTDGHWVTSICCLLCIVLHRTCMWKITLFLELPQKMGIGETSPDFTPVLLLLHLFSFRLIPDESLFHHWTGTGSAHVAFGRSIVRWCVSAYCMPSKFSTDPADDQEMLEKWFPHVVSYTELLTWSTMINDFFKAWKMSVLCGDRPGSPPFNPSLLHWITSTQVLCLRAHSIKLGVCFSLSKSFRALGPLMGSVLRPKSTFPRRLYHCCRPEFLDTLIKRHW